MLTSWNPFCRHRNFAREAECAKRSYPTANVKPCKTERRNSMSRARTSFGLSRTTIFSPVTSVIRVSGDCSMNLMRSEFNGEDLVVEARELDHFLPSSRARQILWRRTGFYGDVSAIRN